MTELDIKTLELQEKRADLQLAELEYKILEREADIARIRDHIQQQKSIIKSCQEKLAQAKGSK